MMRTLFAVCVLSLAVPGQGFLRTAHPQDVPHPSTGQVVPFGNDSMFCEARSQLLIPSQYLPGPGALLMGIEAAALLSGQATYTSLQIAVSPVPAGSTRLAQFDLNLPTPTTVFQSANLSVNWPNVSWQPLMFSQVYQHDGVSDLTIDIQKVAVPGFGEGASTGLFRSDLPTMLVTFGGAGSGQNTAAVASWQVIPIDVRLLWLAAPTARLSSAIAPTAQHGFTIGTSLDHIVSGAPGSVYVSWIAQSLLSAPQGVPPIQGLWRVQGVTLQLGFVGAASEAVQTIPIPNLPALIGQYFVFQSGVLDAQTGIPQFTNVVDCFLEQ